MLRLTTNIVKCPLTMGLLTQKSTTTPLQIIKFNQKRWLAQRIENEDYKKITPLGWFLLLIPATAFGLGCWQVRRKAWKEDLIRQLELKTTMDPVPLPENLSDLDYMEYNLVRVRGKFLHDKEILMGPRSLIRHDGSETAGGLFTQRDGGNGYLVITPFQLADRNEIVLINRGWVPRTNLNQQTRLKGQYDKELELTGIVRLPENRPQFTPDHKGETFLYRDLPKMCSLTGAEPVYLDATYESSIPGGPIGGQTRVTLRNEHLSYFVTWYSLSAFTSYMWYLQILKRRPF